MWQKSHEKYAWDCIATFFKFGRNSMMVWGALVTLINDVTLIIIPLNRKTTSDFVILLMEGLSLFFIKNYTITLGS